jgi:Tol biopolymer transport system component
MLVVQYTKVLSRPAYDERYRPIYGAVDSVVWAIPAEGTPRKWLDDGLDKVRLEASPDGTMVAYIVNGKNGEYNSVWMAEADGSNPQQLTPDYPTENLCYVSLVGWSANSKKIAYRFDCVKDVRAGSLYVIDVPSKQIDEMDIGNVKSATWLPKSSNLILTYDYPLNAHLFDVNTQEVISRTGPLRPTLPDGVRGYEISEAGVLTVYAADGSQLYQVDLGHRTDGFFWSTWSPDSKWFVFIVLGENGLSDIYKVSEGGKTSQLTLEGSQVSPSDHPWLERNLTNLRLTLTWSPDGQWFGVFNFFNHNGEGELYVVNVETNEIRTVMTLNPFNPDVDGIVFMVWLE